MNCAWGKKYTIMTKHGGGGGAEPHLRNIWAPSPLPMPLTHRIKILSQKRNGHCAHTLESLTFSSCSISS